MSITWKGKKATSHDDLVSILESLQTKEEGEELMNLLVANADGDRTRAENLVRFVANYFSVDKSRVYPLCGIKHHQPTQPS